MKTVFEANNGLEAHMVLNLLGQSGIVGELIGQDLPGAVGELPADGLVKIVVDDADQAAAHAVIHDWESRQPEFVPNPPKPMSRGFVGFLFGAACAAAIAVWLDSGPSFVDGIDFDGDGKLDEVYHWRGTLIEKVEQDLNFDGEVDLTTFYTDGYPSKAEGDADFDGVVDQTIRYKNGVLDRVQFIDPNSGKVRKSQRWSGLLLTEAEWDSDGDGRLDTLIKYDLFAEEIERSP